MEIDPGADQIFQCPSCVRGCRGSWHHTFPYRILRPGADFSLLAADYFFSFENRELIPLLSSTRSLLEINLWNNGIGAEGATALAEALGRDGGATLEDLDVGCNAIGCRGAAALAKVLNSLSPHPFPNLMIPSPQGPVLQAWLQTFCFLPAAPARSLCVQTGASRG